MVSIFGIWLLFEKKEFKEADESKKLQMFYKEYERAAEKKFFPDWQERWKCSKPLVIDLLTLKFETTDMMLSSTTWKGITMYNYQLINCEPIKHNSKLITLWMAIQTIWGYKECRDYLFMHEMGLLDKKAIQDSVKLFQKEHYGDIRDYDYSEITNGTVRYFDLISYESSSNQEAFYNGTDTRIIKALIY